MSLASGLATRFPNALELAEGNQLDGGEDAGEAQLNPENRVRNLLTVQLKKLARFALIVQ